VLLDLQRPEGMDVFWKLVDTADVVMQNFPQGTAERYGFGVEAVKARKPDAIYFSLSALGYGGPWGPRRGYEVQGQAAAGISERQGGDGPPQGQPYALNDYGTGMMGAFTAGLALYHRLMTGQSQHAHTSLVQTATYHQTPYVLEYQGRDWSQDPRGVPSLGWEPLQRLYKGSDAWFFLGAGPDQQKLLEQVPGLEGLGSLPPAQLEKELEQRLATRPAQEWVSCLLKVGLGASTIPSLDWLMEDQWARDRDLTVVHDLEGFGPLTLPGIAVQMSRTPMRINRPARPPGADGPAVLESVGLKDQVPDLEKSGVIITSGIPLVGREGMPTL
jgi:crotonobetainyl-CoA:carnitine CoA-transferase CaiB-like acyl-CoA transferase